MPTRRDRDCVYGNAADKGLAAPLSSHATSSPSMTSERTPGRRARASIIQRTRLEWSCPFLVKAAAELPCAKSPQIMRWRPA
jgi:hypothetical protein